MWNSKMLDRERERPSRSRRQNLGKPGEYKRGQRQGGREQANFYEAISWSGHWRRLGKMDTAPSRITWELWKTVRSSWRPSKQYKLLTVCNSLLRKCPRGSMIAKGYSDLEIEASIVVQVMWPWTKQVTFLSLSFLHVRCRRGEKKNNKKQQLSCPGYPTNL